jgi:hypothetical protein
MIIYRPRKQNEKADALIRQGDKVTAQNEVKKNHRL